MPELLSFFTALSLGLLGGAHCLGMCGGIMGALTMAIGPQEYTKKLCIMAAYNVGRISSYLLIAVIFSWFANTLTDYFLLGFMRFVAGILLIFMGLYLANWWRGLVALERVGAVVWQYIQPWGKSLLPVKYSWQALLLGCIWGWLPCGLVYTALAYASTSSTLTQAAVTMLGFGLGTLPAVVAGGLMAERFSRWVKHTWLRRSFGVLIIVFGLWTLYMASMHAHSAHASAVNTQAGHGHPQAALSILARFSLAG